MTSTGGQRRSVALAEERVSLEGWLDGLRDLLRLGADGLTEDEARRRLSFSRVTIIGILQHVAAVERFWFQRTLEGLDSSAINGLSDVTETSWHVSPDVSLASVLADYQVACADSREAASRYDLDHVTPHDRNLGTLTLRWIYMHMVEELARHAGYADILRGRIESER